MLLAEPNRKCALTSESGVLDLFVQDRYQIYKAIFQIEFPAGLSFRLCDFAQLDATQPTLPSADQASMRRFLLVDIERDPKRDHRHSASSGDLDRQIKSLRKIPDSIRARCITGQKSSEGSKVENFASYSQYHECFQANVMEPRVARSMVLRQQTPSTQATDRCATKPPCPREVVGTASQSLCCALRRQEKLARCRAQCRILM